MSNNSLAKGNNDVNPPAYLLAGDTAPFFDSPGESLPARPGELLLKDFRSCS